MTEDERDCDIFVSGRLNRHLFSFILKYGSKKKYLVWTNEPRFDIHYQNKVKPFMVFSDVHIMNVYTRDIYQKNYSCHSYPINQRLELLDESNFPSFNHRRIVAIMGYRKRERKNLSLKKDGRELDLINLRQKIALEGLEIGTVDIYGRLWPQGIALEQSRGTNWQSSKLEILQKYHFNLCFENTNFDYYCTEKIWQSIQGRCLPIYYGKGNKIYEDFPKNSFLDYSNFRNPKELFLYINQITVSEFRERMNLCIEAYNTVYEKLQSYNPGKEMLLKIVDKIKKIAEN